MNQRFRFRVWDKEWKEWNSSGANFSHDDYTHPKSTGTLETKDKERFIIQQCTGLKDYTGELIFEGDILVNQESQKIAKTLDLNFNSEVYWDQDSWRLSRDPAIPLSRFSKCLKIIGNIFEGIYEKN